jgi:RNA polymerase sigma factor (sigma-70 family)
MHLSEPIQPQPAPAKKQVKATKRQGTSKATDIELCLLHRAGKEAMTEILARHGGLARAWAARLKREGQCCSHDDLVQEARRGLIDAAGHFDPARGAFSTVASLWIRKRILAHIEKVKQFSNGQSDVIAEQVGEERTGTDRSHLINEFDRIEKLYRLGWIDERDVLIMRAICSPLSEQDEVLKPLFAAWWKQAQRNTLRRVAEAVRGYQENKARIGRGKIMQDMEMQREMW